MDACDLSQAFLLVSSYSRSQLRVVCLNVSSEVWGGEVTVVENGK